MSLPTTGLLSLVSATPTSNAGIGGDGEITPEDKLLLDELGEIYYSLTYDEALDRELISPFEVNYVGFDLTDRERTLYDQFTRKLSSAIGDIESRYGHRLSQLNGGYSQKLQVIKTTVMAQRQQSVIISSLLKTDVS